MACVFTSSCNILWKCLLNGLFPSVRLSFMTIHEDPKSVSDRLVHSYQLPNLTQLLCQLRLYIVELAALCSYILL